MDRRTFVKYSLGAGLSGGGLLSGREIGPSIPDGRSICELKAPPPSYSLLPVVSDGKWIWATPPKGQIGLLEPRKYTLKIGISIEGTGGARAIKATTVVPVEHPGQTIDDSRVERAGCNATLRKLAPGAGQLLLTAPSIARGQTIRAAVTLRMTIHKQYHGYEADQFPAKQTAYPREFRQRYLNDSPGIQTRVKMVRQMAEDVGRPFAHPWDKAKVYAEWAFTNIKARLGRYTSVVAAVRDRVGDCEERAATFVAFCRIAGIPARLVWVPNHNWAEFYLTDHDGKGHWIPAHTSCYSWFGWTGAHELVLQKGDRIHIPEKRTDWRLLADWAQWSGSRPRVRYLAELVPDDGPGARIKDEKGEWELQDRHPMDRYMRR